jgi:hypothetical protein
MNDLDLIEVSICEGVSEKVIIETLTRIGIADKKNKILYPSVYLYKDNDRYFMCHFKELFLIRDEGYNNISQEDVKRRNSIVYCLYNWELIDVDLERIKPYDERVFILPYKDKRDWKITHKYRMSY